MITPPPVSRVLSQRTRVLTIDDNLARHERELAALGATPEDLEPLRAAAAAVAEVERQEAVAQHRNPALNKSDILDITAPREVGPWSIAPPSKPARRWAATAVISWTGGVAPETEPELRIAIVCGLHILDLAGRGETLCAMRLCANPRRLATAVEAVYADLDDVATDALTEHYSALMGLDIADAGKKKVLALERYQWTLHSLRTRFGATMQPFSPSFPPPPSSSTSTGPATSPPRTPCSKP